VAALNTSLLCVDYGIKGFELSCDSLTPGVPGRADYVHALADLLAADNGGVVPVGSLVRGIDIGCGATCIYPLIAGAEYGWSFVGVDTSEDSLVTAKQLVKASGTAVQLRRQPRVKSIFGGVSSRSDGLAFSMCNPPFHVSERAAMAQTKRKWRGLGKSAESNLSFQGRPNELWCDGGEKAFVSRHIHESAALTAQLESQEVQSPLWYSSLVSAEKTLPKLLAELRAIGAVEIEELPLGTANKRSRILAWSFLSSVKRANGALALWG
jgi:23S rRNA (adenine1618-N6)-methyltransferase